MAGRRLRRHPGRSSALAASEPGVVAHALVRAASRLIGMPGKLSVVRQASPKVATRHARVRAPQARARLQRLKRGGEGALEKTGTNRPLASVLV